jgi:hypothetical protein
MNAAPNLEPLDITDAAVGIPGSDHDLFLGSGADCVTVRLNRMSLSFPPCPAHLTSINKTIAGLGTAVHIIADLLEDEQDPDNWNKGVALNGLADAIVLHARLAEAINSEAFPDETEVRP